MKHFLYSVGVTVGVSLLGVVFVASDAKAFKKKQAEEIATCEQSLGSVAIDDPQNQWWHYYNLGNPEALIKLLVQRSGCFDLVDRGRGMAMRANERDLADSGELQRRSNMGKGQVRVADYFIIPDIVGSDENAGGSGVAGAAAKRFGGKVGGLFGGMKSKKLTAHTLLSVINARTSESMFVSEGKVKKKDISFGAGGFVGFVGAVGGGYDDTEIGQVISAAYVVAYNDLVARIRSLPPPSRDEPKQAYSIAFDTYMYKGPNRDEELRKIGANSMVYPTGNKDGIFFEVEDDFGIVGWVSVEDLAGS